jgi:hypothetical protein
MARVRIRPGRSCSLWWADDASGHFRARDYFNDLSDAERAKFDALFRRLAEEGRIRNPEHFTKESVHIYCFKRGKLRITCFQEGSDWMLLHGFKKTTNSDRRHRREIATAERIRTEHLDRT